MHLIAKIELTEAFVISNFSCIEGSRTPKEYRSNPSRKTREIAENTIIKKSVVSDSKIGSEVKIGPYSHIRQDSDISNKVYIGTNVEVKKSKIESGSKLGHFCYIGDSMIEKNVNIGAGTVTCNFDGKEKQKTSILNNAFIGSGTMIVAPVIIGQNAVVGAGSVVTKDVENDQLVYGNPATNKKSL